jgi:hypothetical protein
MNPYQTLFRNPFDVVTTWTMVIAWLLIGAAIMRVRDLARHRNAESYCWPAERAFLWLCALLAVNTAVGLVFIAWLHITSPVWSFWEFLLLLSIICIFQVLPFIAAFLVGWSALDMWRHGRSRSRILFTAACPLALAINAALIFILDRALK